MRPTHYHATAAATWVSPLTASEVIAGQGERRTGLGRIEVFDGRPRLLGREPLYDRHDPKTLRTPSQDPFFYGLPERGPRHKAGQGLCCHYGWLPLPTTRRRDDVTDPHTARAAPSTFFCVRTLVTFPNFFSHVSLFCLFRAA